MQIIAIDNGPSGSVAVMTGETNPVFFHVPTIHQQDYTKKQKTIKRIDVDSLANTLSCFVDTNQPVRAFIERPFVNPQMFNSSIIAVRALEATLICLEDLGIGYQFVDSKEWQKTMLPHGACEKELKKASKDISIRLFPHLEEQIKKQKDGDSLLMAEHFRRIYTEG